MKIGILTFWWTQSNYGQMLQAFALKTYLNEMGNDVFFIKYQASQEKKSFWDRLLGFNLIRFLKRRIENYNVRRQLSKNPRYFDDFKSANFLYSDCTYHSLAELKNNPPVADAYICGSDQVWNNTFEASCEPYLLDFGSDSVKRISFAASFGMKTLSSETREMFIKHLGKFDAISVREKSGVELCNGMGYDNAKLLADPTFLLSKNDWLKIIQAKEQKNESKSIFVYTLGNSPIRDREDFIKFALNTQLRVNHVSANSDLSGTVYPDVFGWLHLINDAGFVITNSFHGMVFCIIFNKNFVVLPNTGKAEGMNERITSLAELFNLSENLMYEFDANQVESLMNKVIDWDKVNESIDRLRKISDDFLLNILNK